MLFEKLEIVRRAANGELYRRITCLAGRVTVFRARTDDEIDLYAGVLRGTVANDRFSVVIDGRPFDPAAHVFLGFDQSPLGDYPGNLWEYLVRCGMPGEQIPGRLEEGGLEGMSQAQVADLNTHQRQVLALIGSTGINDRVLVLHDPFLGIPPMYAETLARRLAEAAWRNRAIVVVTRLTARPETWVENEHITRIQLERPRDRTIGFGGGELSSTEFIQAFREQLKQADSAQISAPKRQLLVESAAVSVVPSQHTQADGPEGADGARKPRQPGLLTAVGTSRDPLHRFRIPKPVMLGAGGVLAAVLVALIIGGEVTPPTRPTKTPKTPAHTTPSGRTSATPQKDPQPVAPQLPLNAQTNPQQHPGQTGVAPPPGVPDQPGGAVPMLPPGGEPRRTPGTGPISLLDAYPPQVQRAVTRAFFEPQSVLRELPAVSYAQPAKPAKPADPGDRSVRLPESVSPPPLPPEARLVAPNTVMESPPQRSPEELQAQRELLRRAFVDAVMRARERQMQMQYGDQGYPQ